MHRTLYSLVIYQRLFRLLHSIKCNIFQVQSPDILQPTSSSCYIYVHQSMPGLKRKVDRCQKSVALCTIIAHCNWLKDLVKCWHVYFLRRASTSVVAGADITMNEIMQAADWNSQFYYQLSHDVPHGRTVLSSSTIDETWPFVCTWLALCVGPQWSGPTSYTTATNYNTIDVRLSLLTALYCVYKINQLEQKAFYWHMKISSIF